MKIAGPKTSTQIYLDYQAALKTASELESEANQVIQQKKQLEGIRGSLSANWKSDSAAAYLRKLATLEAELNTVSANLKSAAQTVRQTAKNIYEADKRALAIAQMRQAAAAAKGGK